jgi:hypothetical protein
VPKNTTLRATGKWNFGSMSSDIKRRAALTGSPSIVEPWSG